MSKGIIILLDVDIMLLLNAVSHELHVIFQTCLDYRLLQMKFF